MRLFIYFLFWVSFFAMACKQTAMVSGWQRAGLNGKVKTATDSFFHTSNENGKWAKEDVDEYGPKTVVQFDQNGSMLYSETSIPYVHYYSKEVPTYNEKGIETGGKIYNAQQQINETYRVDSFCNQLYPAIITVFDSAQTFKQKLKWFYNADFRFEGIEGRDKNDSLLFKSEYTYDNQNRMVKRVDKGTQDNTDNITAIVYLSFDKKNNWTERLEIKNKGEFKLVQRTIVYY